MVNLNWIIPNQRRFNRKLGRINEESSHRIGDEGSVRARKLAITEDGYHKYIWPGVHANTPGTNEKRFYSMFQRGSAAGTASALKGFGGRKMEFVRISMGTPIRQTKGYRLLPSPSVTVKDASGQERTLNLTGAIVEHDGGLAAGSSNDPLHVAWEDGARLLRTVADEVPIASAVTRRVTAIIVAT